MKEKRNLFSYESFKKLEDNNYELWSKTFMMSVKRKFLVEDEPNNKAGKYSIFWILNSIQPQIAATIVYFQMLNRCGSSLKELTLTLKIINIFSLKKSCHGFNRVIWIWLSTSPLLLLC